jgi:predicted AAA+ superfamily ATPase
VVQLNGKERFTLSQYIPRILDERLRRLNSHLTAVAIEGARGVGKTSSATQLAGTVVDLDSESTAAAVTVDPALLLEEDPPVLLDEWQRVPSIWDFVRRQADRSPQPGRFLLTGSAAPLTAQIHSGAGRIARLRMRPLSLAERQLESSTVSLAKLLDDPDYRPRGHTKVTLRDYVDEIAASGFPGIRGMEPDIRDALLDGYITNVVEREFAEQGLAVRRPEALRAWLRAYAGATGSTASYTAILDAATPGEADKPGKSSTQAYRSVLASLWLTDDVPAWAPIGSGIGALGKTAKHYLADPALAMRLLEISPRGLIRGDDHRPVGPQGGTVLGHLFESLIALSLQTYCQASGATLSHLRTSTGHHEVDFVVTKADRAVALEVKVAATVNDDDLRHLKWFAAHTPTAPPALGVITMGDRAYVRPDGIHVIPAALLGP